MDKLTPQVRQQQIAKFKKAKVGNRCVARQVLVNLKIGSRVSEKHGHLYMVKSLRTNSLYLVRGSGSGKALSYYDFIWQVIRGEMRVLDVSGGTVEDEVRKAVEDEVKRAVEEDVKKQLRARLQ
jgi:hypothetical protein